MTKEAEENYDRHSTDMSTPTGFLRLTVPMTEDQPLDGITLSGEYLYRIMEEFATQQLQAQNKRIEELVEGLMRKLWRDEHLMVPSTELEEMIEYYTDELLQSQELLEDRCLKIGVDVHLKGRKDIIGRVEDKSDIGFNHWLIRWDNTGYLAREYGLDLRVVPKPTKRKIR